MYFPKSQIKPNQVTNGGEFQFLSTGEEYVGSYFTTSTGKIYSGKTPQDLPVKELVPLNNDRIVQGYDADDDPIGSWDRESSLYTLDEGYLNSTTLNFNQDAPLPPKQFYVRPTEKNYENGEILRFFASKNNEPKFIEIDINQYKEYKNKSELTQYRLYNVYNLFWQISGDRNDVYNTNLKTVTLLQQNKKLPGFVSYFQDKFDQFYKASNVVENLETDGTEFRNRKTGEPYTGPYHIHPEFGPMVGATHVETPHNYLDPIIASTTTGSSNNQQVGRGSFGGY